MDALTKEILLRSFQHGFGPDLTASLIDESRVDEHITGVHDTTEAEAAGRIQMMIERGLIGIVTTELADQVWREIDECGDSLESLSRRTPAIGGIMPTETGQQILRGLVPRNWHGSHEMDSATGFRYYWQLEYADREQCCPFSDDFFQIPNARYRDCETRGCRVMACGPWWSTWWWRHPTGYLILCKSLQDHT